VIDRKPPDRERLDQLLADRAVFGLSRREYLELDSLITDFPETDTDDFDRIVACVDLALAPGRFEPLPEALRATIRQQVADNRWPHWMENH
jgi:hypothetical protein